MFPWLSLLQFIPVIVTGIEHIHGDVKSGATKKQLALEALGLASGVAIGALPNNQPEVQQFTQVASDAIDATVAAFNKQGWPVSPTVTPAFSSPLSPVNNFPVGVPHRIA